MSLKEIYQNIKSLEDRKKWEYSKVKREQLELRIANLKSKIKNPNRK